MAQNSIYEAALKGDFDAVAKQLEENPALLNAKDSCDRIPLHWASVGGNLKLVTHLLDLGSLLDPLDDTETSPLILASASGHTEIVDLLIGKGARLDQQTINGHAALQYAASKGFLAICVKLLESGANINIADTRGGTALQRAASKGNLEIVKLLLEYKNDLNINHRDIYGNSALHLACEDNCKDEAVLLVQNGADLDLLNKRGQTPLDLCSIQLAKLLKATQAN